MSFILFILSLVYNFIYCLFEWQDSTKRPYVALFDSPEPLKGSPRGHMTFLWEQFAKMGLKLHFWVLLRIFCRLIFDKNKRCQGFISIIRENGCVIPVSLCANNNNLTLFLRQTKWLHFFTSFLPPCMNI